MGEQSEPVDLLVIGGGPAGYTAAARAAALGRQVTLVERETIGGICLNVGCIPSKMLIEHAEAHAKLGSSPADLSTWQNEKSTVVSRLGSAVSGQMDAAAVDVIAGEARFTGRNRVAVSTSDGPTTFLEFRHAVIATGSRPAPLDALPLDGDRVLDSTGALALTEVPRTMVVVGAGYIGLELATAYAKLGSAVTLIEAQDRILPQMAPMLARPVTKRLDELGVTVHTGAAATEVTEEGLGCTVDGSSQVIAADRILVVVGRIPNTDELGLDAARVKVGADGRIPVGPNMRVAGTNVAAIGDVVRGPMLAHKATAEAVVAVDALCGGTAKFDPAAIPLVVFSDPEIASAGHTEDTARTAGIETNATTVPLTAIGRAVAMGIRHGFAQVVVDTERDALIGVHVVGPHASELIAAGVLALEMAASPTDLAATIHPHPTLSEALHEAACRAVRQSDARGASK